MTRGERAEAKALFEQYREARPSDDLAAFYLHVIDVSGKRNDPAIPAGLDTYEIWCETGTV